MRHIERSVLEEYRWPFNRRKEIDLLEKRKLPGSQYYEYKYKGEWFSRERNTLIREIE